MLWNSDLSSMFVFINATHFSDSSYLSSCIYYSWCNCGIADFSEPKSSSHFLAASRVRTYFTILRGNFESFSDLKGRKVFVRLTLVEHETTRTIFLKMACFTTLYLANLHNLQFIIIHRSLYISCKAHSLGKTRPKGSQVRKKFRQRIADAFELTRVSSFANRCLHGFPLFCKSPAASISSRLPLASWLSRLAFV